MNRDNEYLYHYTSLNGLVGIIKNKNIWATHTRFLNDYQEIKEGFEYFLKNKERLLDSILNMVDESDITSEIQENIKLRFEEFNQFNKIAIEDEPIFITSFTTERDNLTHWLSYGSNETSYCLKINKDKLVSPTYLLKDTQQDVLDVEYINIDLESDCFNQLSSVMYESFMELYNLNNVPHDEPEFLLGRGLFDIYLHFLFTCSSIKNKKYADEKENRLIVISPANFSVNGSHPQDYYSSDCNMDKLDKENYFDYIVKCRTSNGVLVPYIEVPFDIDSIEEIIIGPSNSEQEAKIGLDYFCKEHKIEPEITLTECPFRAL